MKRKKDIGIIIQFDDKEYSKEETIFLYQRFISILLEAKDIKIDSKIIENTAKALVSKIFKTSKEVRTSEKPINKELQRYFKNNRFLKKYPRTPKHNKKEAFKPLL